MNVTNNSNVDLKQLYNRLEREGNSTGITNKTFGDLVAYVTNSNEKYQTATVGKNLFTVDRDTGEGSYTSDGKCFTRVSNDGKFIDMVKIRHKPAADGLLELQAVKGLIN